MSNYTFSACCVSSGMTFSIPVAEIPQPLNIGEIWRVKIDNTSVSPTVTEFLGCATVIAGMSTTVYSGGTYIKTLTGNFVDCATCQSTNYVGGGIDCCVSGQVDNVSVYYTDCCGNYISVGTPGDYVCFDPNYPFTGLANYGDTCSVPCTTPTPTPSLTNTQTPTNTETPTNTPTVTQTPTNTTTVTQTPTNTPTFTQTPSITASQTSTPLACSCKQYQLVNTSLTDTANITYYDCYLYEQNDYIPPDSIFEICCCEGTIIIPSYVSASLIGDCSEFNPSPTPSNTSTPTVTPSETTTTTVPCTDEYCLQTNLSAFSTYDGTYYSAGTHNGFLYFTGGTEPGYIFFDNISWCLSDSLGGSCLISGPVPYTNNCPDFDSTLLYSGACSTTTTTTNPCSTFDFEAYFDCDYSTTTTTTISCDDTDLNFTVSAYTTTTTTICTGTSVTASFTRYTTTTTTPSPITTTTTTLTVFFNSVVTFTVFEEEVSCPNLTYQFTDCNTEQNYYVSKIPEVGGIPISPGEVFQLYINTYLVCATYIGTSNQSPNSILDSIVFISPDCTTCLSTL